VLFILFILSILSGSYRLIRPRFAFELQPPSTEVQQQAGIQLGRGPVRKVPAEALIGSRRILRGEEFTSACSAPSAVNQPPLEDSSSARGAHGDVACPP